MAKHTRSVSPHSLDEPARKKRSRFGLSSLLGIFQSSKPEPQVTNPDISVVETPLANDFSSQKKKRLSIQGHISTSIDHVPRSSGGHGNLGFYQTYYDSLRTAKEEESNDLERRMSTVYDNLVKESAENYLDVPIEDTKEDSPLLNTVRRNTGLVMVENIQANSTEDAIEEYPEVYQDDEGNLVRPPFINLDPRERYQLLQLKKSIETSNALQNRLKYMVDPAETESTEVKPGKVEASTQTHNVAYLESKLKFNKGFKQRFKVAKPKKRGVFSGELLYDVKKDEPRLEKAKELLDGYLGQVRKPKFNTDKKPSTVVNDTFGVKPQTKRPGLDASLRLGQKPDLSLDPSYVEQSEKISNIIKVKSPEAKKDTARPSSGFKFNIDEKEVNDIIQRKQETKPVNGDTKPVSESKPLFSLPDTKTEKKEAKPLFSLPDTKADKKEGTPLFSFEGTEKPASTPSQAQAQAPSLNGGATPSISFGSTATKGPKPAFSFNKHAEAEKEDIDEPRPKKRRGSFEPEPKKPALSFNLGEKRAPLFSSKPEKAAETEQKPLFSFGAADKSETKSDKPLFSFGSEKKEENVGIKETKPLFSFGGATKLDDTEKKDKPLFSFGDKKEAESKPSFSFGEKKGPESKPFTLGEKKEPDSKPSFSFGEKQDAAPKPTFSFTPSKKEEAKSVGVSESKPLFGAAKLFSSEPKDGSKSEVPKFSFGATKAPEVPTLSLGSKDTTAAKPAFSFSSDKPEPKFSFGASKSAEPEPKFAFGDKKESSSTPQPSQSFSKPSFNFGATEKPSFGATPAKDTSFGSSAPFGQTNPNPPTTAAVPTANSFDFSFNGPKPAAPFSFGSNNSTPAPPLSSFNFGQTQAPSSGFSFTPNNAFGQTPAAPALAPTFSQSPFGQTALAPAAPFGGNTSFGQQQQPGFGFNPSRSSTPPAFGAAGTPGAPAQSYTPPIIANRNPNRRIAQMRPRRR